MLVVLFRKLIWAIIDISQSSTTAIFQLVVAIWVVGQSTYGVDIAVYFGVV